MAVGFLVAISVLVLIGLVAGAIVYVFRSDEPEVRSWNFVLRGYLHLAALVSTLIVVFGLISLLTALVTAPLGRDFSYMVEVPRAAVPPGVRPVPEGALDPELAREQMLRDQIERAEAQYRDDLVRGATLGTVGFILWLVHSVALQMVETAEQRRRSWLNRLHRIGSLGIFGLGGLVALPMAVYAAMRYMVGDPQQWSPRPGGDVAAAVVFVPIWVYQLWLLARLHRRDRAIDSSMGLGSDGV